MVSQSFAREFGPRGIHVAHVIIDGSINGDKIFSKVADIGSRRDRTACLTLMRSLTALVSTYATSFCLVAGARCASICRNLLSLGRPISSHGSRRDIFGLGLSSMTLFVFFRPVRVVKPRKEWKRPTSWREILPGGRRRYSIWRWDCPGAACPNLRNVAVAHPHVGPRREGRAFAAAMASSHKAHCRRL